MSDKMSQSNDQPPSQHGSQDNRPDAPDLLFRPPLPTDDGWEYYRRGPQLLASIGNWSWIRRASRERLARQHKGQDGEYIHHWWIKDQCSPKTPAIAEDAQALANTWGKELHRSADEPETEPVFSPDEIRFNAQRMSAFTGLQTNKQLQTALDAASGPAPTDIIIRNPDGEPTRVSWLDTNGELMHRPFDGAFPADYPAALAVRQCTEVLYRLISYPNNSARDRAYTMLSMAQAGLHSFDYDSGRWVNAELQRAGLDEDAKHTIIMKLHPHPSVGQLLLQRCGMRSKLDFTHFKRRKRERLQLNGTG